MASANGHGHTIGRARMHVAGREHARKRGLIAQGFPAGVFGPLVGRNIAIGQDVSSRIEFDRVDPSRLRFGADLDQEVVEIDVLLLVALLDSDARHPIGIPTNLDEGAVRVDLDIGSGRHVLDEVFAHVVFETFATNEHIHEALRAAREKPRSLTSAVATADDADAFAFPLARNLVLRRSVLDAAAHELLHAFRLESPVGNAKREHDRGCRYLLAVRRRDDEVVILLANSYHPERGDELGTEGFGLVDAAVHELLAAQAPDGNAEDVLHFRARSDLSTRALFVEHHNRGAFRAETDCCRDSSRTCADDGDVVCAWHTGTILFFHDLLLRNVLTHAVYNYSTMCQIVNVMATASRLRINKKTSH